jgi:hypothetical protein
VYETADKTLFKLRFKLALVKQNVHGFEKTETPKIDGKCEGNLLWHGETLVASPEVVMEAAAMECPAP